jgi:phosphohistidine swiveling domain-containing protein
MTAELASAATAAAAYRQLELTLASHVDDVEAGRLAGRLTAQRGVVAVPPTHASAAVFAGPSWAESGRSAPDPPAVRPTATSRPLRTRLGTTPGFDPDAPLGWFRWRRIERTITGAVEHLGDAENRPRPPSSSSAARSAGCISNSPSVSSPAARSRRATDVDLLTGAELIAGLRATPDLRSASSPDAAGGDAGTRTRDRSRCGSRVGPTARFRASLPGNRLEGSAASGGRCTDRAVFMTRRRCTPEGAILVAEATDASWSPAFVHAGAIVLERGGPLSHAAILARELGVPAVLNVGLGVRSLDGRLVTVDGDSGIVVVHEDPRPPPPRPPPTERRTDESPPDDARTRARPAAHLRAGADVGGPAVLVRGSAPGRAAVARRPLPTAPRRVVRARGRRVHRRRRRRQPPEAIGLRPRAAYAVWAVGFVVVATYIAIGSFLNYTRVGGYVSDIAWLLALALVLAVAFGFAAGISTALWLRWSNLPAWLRAARTGHAWRVSRRGRRPRTRVGS